MSLILDPVEVAEPDRVELDLMSGTIMVRPDGIDWGDTSLELQKGKGKYGEPALDYMLPNRIVRAPIKIESEASGDTMIQAMQDLQAKVARLATEGGKLKRVRKNMDLFADVVSASVTIPDTWTGEHRDFEVDGEITLECLPDFYGNEYSHDLGTSTDGILQDVLEGIGGDYPARVRITVKDTSNAEHRSLGFGFRARNYSEEATASLLYQAEDLQPLDQAAVVSNYVRNQKISNAWTPVLGTRIGGEDFSHIGAYKVLARVQVLGSPPPQLRLSWAQGDYVGWNDNLPAVVPGAGQWYLVDLGEVMLAKPRYGEPRWYGVIQGIMSPGAGVGTVSIDRIILQPRDESAGILVQEPSQRSQPSGFLVNDEFLQSSGNLVGKTPTPSGLPNYSALVAGGTDFQVNTGIGAVRRSSTGVTNGVFRADGLALNLQDVSASIDIRDEGWNSANPAKFCLIIKAVNSNNYLILERSRIDGYSQSLVLKKRISGSETILDSATVPTDQNIPSDWQTMILSADQFGNWSYQLRGATGNTSRSGTDLDIGALSGGVYIGDQSTSDSGLNRDYDNFRVWMPISTATIFSGRSAELTSEGCFREAASGGAFGPIVPYGDLPRLPVSGREARKVEALLFSTGSDLVSTPDNTFRNIEATLHYRPCWSSVPEES